MPIYAITGATGHVGGAAARFLLAAGASVRAVVRSEESAAEWRARGAEAARAAFDDPASLTSAFSGVDGVFIMTPTFFDAEDMFAENTRVLAVLSRAIRAAQPRKIVLLSSIGADKPDRTGPILKLHDLEAAFSDLPAVASVRAAWFMENFAGLVPYVRESGILPSMLAPLDRAVPMVATADIGRAVADLLQEAWQGPRVINLEGPRRYAPNDVAAAFASTLGRDVTAQILPEPQWRPTFLSWGLPPGAADAMAEMLSGFNSGWISYENSTAETARGTTSLEAVLADLARI